MSKYSTFSRDNDASDILTKKMKTFCSATYSNPQSMVSQKVPTSQEEGKNIEMFASVFSYFISSLVLILSHFLVAITLPFSIWFCFENLHQWERIVVYRLGNLQAVKGPGNIFTIPWVDKCTKLDLRTQVIGYPTKQFLTRDQAVTEVSFNIYYRIYDPVRYVNSIQDPELIGLKKLAAAVSLKHIESSDVADLETEEKSLPACQKIQQELSVITSTWGIEISSVEM